MSVGTAADELVVGGGLSLSASSYLDVVGGGVGPWVISTYGGVLSGTFGHVTSGYAVDYATPGQLILKVIGLVGDYNSDGKVDSADYVVWRNDPTSFGGAGGYTNWRTHFGTHAGSGSATLETTVVPEPGTVMLVVAGALALCCRSILASLVRSRGTDSSK